MAEAGEGQRQVQRRAGTGGVCGALMMRESDFSLGGIEIAPCSGWWDSMPSAPAGQIVAPEFKRASKLWTLPKLNDRIAGALSTAF
jgi:hypothetical protein